VEKQVLDSREKLEYYRSKMQDLVSTIVIWDQFGYDIKKLFLMINFLVLRSCIKVVVIIG
jgi:hypothetical protein